jgi:hypothetical protein
MKGTNNPLPCLVVAFHQVLGRREKREEQEKKPMSHTYNAETSLEFHNLLIAALHSYKNVLVALFKETKDRNKGILGDNTQRHSKKDARKTLQGSYQEDLKGWIQCAHWLWSLTCLLWHIAHSRMLH